MHNFEARAVIGALRRGIPPQKGIEGLTVGLDDELAELRSLLAPSEGARGATRCIEGDFGQGKTHLLGLVKERALAANWVVSKVTLDRRHTTLSGLVDAFRRSMDNLQTPGGVSGDGLWHLLQRWSRAFEGSQMTHPQLSRENAPARLFHDLQCWLRTEDPGIHKQLLESIAGANVLSSRHRQTYLKVGYVVSEALAFKGSDVVPAWETIARLARVNGYRGLLLLFDEVESQVDLTLPGRLKAYQLLMDFWVTPPTGVAAFFAFTPAFFNFARADHRAKQRGAKEAIDVLGKIQRLRLRPLDGNLLLELMRKVGLIHGCAFRTHYSATEIDDCVAAVLRYADSLPLRRLLRLMVEFLDLKASNSGRTITLR